MKGGENMPVEMMASRDFCLFVLGACGLTFFTWLHTKVVKCDPTIFSIVCIILAYGVINIVF